MGWLEDSAREQKFIADARKKQATVKGKRKTPAKKKVAKKKESPDA